MVAALIVVTTINPALRDLTLLIVFMAGTGITTVSMSYLLYRRGLARWLRSLRWALLFTVIVTVLVMFINVWVTAKLMFINYHDLALTTALLLFAGLTAIAFGFFIASTITDTIGELASTARQLAQGDFSARLEVRGNDELAKLAATFNWMASNLQELDDQKRRVEQTRRNLIAWVSHDLRTPLASMRVMIEAMLDGLVTDPDSVTRYLNNTHNEIQHLSRLINDLFELAQLDVGHLNMAVESASLNDLISDTIGKLSVQASGKQVTLKGSADPQVDPVMMAPDKIQRVLYNLIDNAIQHTPAGGEINVRAYTETGQARIDVHNTGAEIAADDLPYIFTSFYRGEISRAKSQDGQRGAGLGLAISRGFVEAHGGKIWLENNRAAQGVTFSFTLPRDSQAGRQAAAPSLPRAPLN